MTKTNAMRRLEEAGIPFTTESYEVDEEDLSGVHTADILHIEDPGCMFKTLVTRACVNLELSKKNSSTMYLNGQLLYSETYSLPQMLAISEVTAGDVVEIKLSCKNGESGTMYVSAAIVNEDVFRKGYDILNASTLELTTFKNTYIDGTIQCNRDGVLYTSIPQNGNWIVSVDGQPAEAVMIGDAMVGVLLSEGYHQVSFTYQNKAFSIGWKITVVSLLIFLALYWFYYRPSIKESIGKFQKKKQ